MRQLARGNIGVQSCKSQDWQNVKSTIIALHFHWRFYFLSPLQSEVHWRMVSSCCILWRIHPLWKYTLERSQTMAGVSSCCILWHLPRQIHPQLPSAPLPSYSISVSHSMITLKMKPRSPPILILTHFMSFTCPVYWGIVGLEFSRKSLCVPSWMKLYNNIPKKSLIMPASQMLKADP